MKALTLQLTVASLTCILGVGLTSLLVTLTSQTRANVQFKTSGQTSELPSLAAQIKPCTSPNSPIRSIDFENFTFPEIETRGTFTLKDEHEPKAEERRGIVDVVYGDVTADGIEDAMVVHSQSIRGSAIPYFVYVYAMKGTKPRLLWSFYAGERGDGGLRNISADCGEMVVELYGRERIVNGGTSSDEDNMGVCCPRYFTRSRYEWRAGSFHLKTEESWLPNPQGNAAYLPLLERLDKCASYQ